MTAEHGLKAPAKAFFDPEAFRHSLIDNKTPIPLFKQAIRDARKILDKRFISRGRINEIIHDHTWFIDQILISAWRLYDWRDDGNICLLAVGGYGRGELHPYSDIDIQIMMNKDSKNKYKSNVESFLTLLWDINLEIGQSVRTIKQNREEAAKDITIITALTESRLLYGDVALHEKLLTVINRKKIWKPDKFFIAKREEQRARHAKHDDIDYALEPNIKVAPGGLRDIQTIGWIAKRYYDASNFMDLVAKGFLQKNEYQELIRGRDFLWRLRYGLHMLAGRREDRLFFNYQRELASLFGYEDDRNTLGIEKLMQQYYQTVQTLRELNDVLLQLFDEDILRSKEKARIRPINSRFQIRNDYIEVTGTRVFRKTPFALMEIFVLMAHDPAIQGIRASTIRLIRNSRGLIDSKFRNDIRNKSLFMELLRSQHRVVRNLRQMKRYGILGAYLPEFGKIIGQMQHDLFHIYAVDDHTLQVMEFMRRMVRFPELEKEFPVASIVVRRLPKIELLLIAGLYHDIAKGRGGDHSELGAEDAEAFCERHYLGKWDTNLVCWLVRNHLSMSAVAQREDIQDPDIIREFALHVGDTVRLDYLYALTVCDINATNPSLWTSWRASLMRQLYSSTRLALSQGLEVLVDKAERIRENQFRALSELAKQGLDADQVRSLWHEPDEDYFFRESVEDIVWHTLAISHYTLGDGPQVLLKNADDLHNEGATKVFVFARQTKYLFANILTAFERLNLDIQDARIYDTKSEFCLSTFMVLEETGAKVTMEAARAAQISKTLVSYVQKQGLQEDKTRSANRKLRYFTRKTVTRLNNDPSQPWTKLEVLCPDRPGLLAKIAAVFVDENIVLHNAKITTLGENVEDVFFITDEHNKALTNTTEAERLQTRIRETLDAEVSAPEKS